MWNRYWAKESYILYFKFQLAAYLLRGYIGSVRSVPANFSSEWRMVEQDSEEILLMRTAAHLGVGRGGGGPKGGLFPCVFLSWTRPDLAFQRNNDHNSTIPCSTAAKSWITIMDRLQRKGRIYHDQLYQVVFQYSTRKNHEQKNMHEQAHCMKKSSINSVQHSSYCTVSHSEADPLPQPSADLWVNPSTNAKLLETIKPNESNQIGDNIITRGDYSDAPRTLLILCSLLVVGKCRSRIPRTNKNKITCKNTTELSNKYSPREHLLDGIRQGYTLWRR